MTLPHLARRHLAEASPADELAGTDILVLPSILLRETGLLPGDVVELRRTNETSGQGIVFTVGFLPGGRLSSAGLLLGRESGALLNLKIASMPSTEVAMVAAPMNWSALFSIDAILLETPLKDGRVNGDAALRVLDDWLTDKKAINGDMEYRWQKELRCLFIGKRPGGWGKVDIIKSRIFFVEAWESWQKAWQEYRMARDELSCQSRLALLAVEKRNKLSRALLYRQNDIQEKTLYRAGIVASLVGTARLLRDTLEDANLLTLSSDINQLWQEMDDESCAHASNEIIPLWEPSPISGSEPALPAYDIFEKDLIMKANDRVTNLPWNKALPLPQPPPPPAEVLRVNLGTWIETLRTACNQFHSIVEMAGTEEELLKVDVDIPLSLSEKAFREYIEKMSVEVKETMNTVSETLRLSAVSLSTAPWHIALCKIAASGTDICHSWGNIQDSNLNTWWQKLYGSKSPDTALREHNTPFEPNGLALAMEITLAAQCLTNGKPALTRAKRTDTQLQNVDF